MTSRNLKNFEFRLGRQGILLFVAGMAGLLFLVFLSGVMVGLHIDAYPEKIAREMPELIRKRLLPAAEKAEDTARSSPAALPAAKADALPGEAEAEDKGPHPIALATPAAVAGAPADGQIAPPREAGENKSIAPAPPVKEEKKEPPPAEPTDIPAAQGKGKYLVQVGSFKSNAKAKEFSRRVKQTGYNPQISVMDSPQKGKWFRVVIDGFETRDKAKKAASLLSAQLKGVNCFVRPVK